MKVAQKPFRKYNLDEEREKPDTFTVRLNKEERQSLDQDKKLLKQPKDSTALKQLAEIGHHVLHDKIIGATIATVFKNERNNRRAGIVEFE